MTPTDIQCHEHHCLVFRSDLPKSKQAGLDDEINVMLVHAECHQILQSNRDIGRKIKEFQHGKGAVNSYFRRMLPRTYQMRVRN